MEIRELISQLNRNAEVINALVVSISDEQARWKPDLKDWSILEVICHLADEEVEDFRTHVDHLLYHTNDPWPEIDPQSWVYMRSYNTQNINSTLLRFKSERRASIVWLSSLVEIDWECGIQTLYGRIKAGDVLCSWAAHDLLHLRQLIELHYAYAANQSLPYKVHYAGEW